MSSVSLVGQDTIIINDRVFADLSNGNVGQIMFENDSANVMVGKDKNAIYAFNAQGVQATVELRVMRGSSDDKFLNNLYSQQCANFVGTTLLTGVFVKKIGDGSGQVENDFGEYLEHHQESMSAVSLFHHIWRRGMELQEHLPFLRYFGRQRVGFSSNRQLSLL